MVLSDTLEFGTPPLICTATLAMTAADTTSEEARRADNTEERFPFALVPVSLVLSLPVARPRWR